MVNTSAESNGDQKKAKTEINILVSPTASCSSSASPLCACSGTHVEIETAAQAKDEVTSFFDSTKAIIETFCPEV